MKTEWKIGDRAMVEIDAVGDNGCFSLKGSGLAVGWAHHSALSALPAPTLSAEDAAVLDAAEKWMIAWSGPSKVEEDAAAHALRLTLLQAHNAIRSRAAAQVGEFKVGDRVRMDRDSSIFWGSVGEVIETHDNGEVRVSFGSAGCSTVTPDALSSAPTRDRQIAEAREKVVAAARRWRQEYPPPAHTWFGYPATSALAIAIDALDALLTPPPPPDPVADVKRAAIALENAYCDFAKVMGRPGACEGSEQHTRAVDKIEAAQKQWRSALATLADKGEG